MQSAGVPVAPGELLRRGSDAFASLHRRSLQDTDDSFEQWLKEMGAPPWRLDPTAHALPFMHTGPRLEVHRCSGA